ncbi:MAG: DUF2339 domain-containing protein [Reyranellaceae bacterium]
MFDDGWVVLVLILVLLVVGGPIMAFVALLRMSDLTREIESLRADLRGLSQLVGRGEKPAGEAAPAPAVPVAPTLSPRPGLAAADGPPPKAEAPAPAATATPPAPPVRKQGFSLEQLLGARAFAWVGALAIALAGVFLVKYSIDQGYLDPPARVILAGVLGAVLLATSEWLRTRDARIAQALAAAGVAVLFSALFSAVALYDLVPRLPASLLAALLTALSVALSLRHGPFVALLGLVGGSMAPAIVADDNAGALVLFAYLLALTGGVLVVVRHRQWWWLGWCVLASAAIWPLVWIMGGFLAAEAHWVGLYLLAVTGLYVWLAWRILVTLLPAMGFAEFIARHVRGLLPLVWSAAGAMLALQALLLAKTGYMPLHWALFVLAGLSVFALGRQAPPLQWLALVPVGLSILLFLGWADDFRWLRPAGASPQGIAFTALVVAGAFSAAAYALMWNARRPGFWAALCAGGAFLHFLALCAALYKFDVGIKWGYASLLLAIPFLIGAERVAHWRERMAGGEAALGMLAVGITFFLSAAVPLELRREWVTMAYAIELPAVAWIAWRLNLPVLRWLAWLLAATVTIRLVFNPYVLDYDVSANPFLNWVLYGYGVPIIAYWIARDFLRRVRNDELVMAVEASILAFAFLLLSLQVRSIFNPDGLGQQRFEAMERAWMAVSWGALALGLIWSDWRRQHAVLRWGWRVIGGLAIALVTFGAAIQGDALFAGEALGKWPILNGLIVCFLIPALMAAGASWMLQRMDQRLAAMAAGIAALGFGFAFLSYEVRHYYGFAQGRISSLASDAELYTYSIVWLVYGAALLVAGILTRQAVLRYASLAVLVLVVGKVFLVDMADLTGLLRVASFLGLGIALLALGFLYRRYVFRDDPLLADTAQPGG